MNQIECFPEKLSQWLEMSFFKNVTPNIFEEAHFKPLRQLFWKTLYLVHLLTKWKYILELLRSKIHLSVFALYEMGVASQCGHTLFQNLKRST
jgi:hypothetical protein